MIRVNSLVARSGLLCGIAALMSTGAQATQPTTVIDTCAPPGGVPQMGAWDGFGSLAGIGADAWQTITVAPGSTLESITVVTVPDAAPLGIAISEGGGPGAPSSHRQRITTRPRRGRLEPTSPMSSTAFRCRWAGTPSPLTAPVPTGWWGFRRIIRMPVDLQALWGSMSSVW